MSDKLLVICQKRVERSETKQSQRLERLLHSVPFGNAKSERNDNCLTGRDITDFLGALCQGELKIVGVGVVGLWWQLC